MHLSAFGRSAHQLSRAALLIAALFLLPPTSGAQQSDSVRRELDLASGTGHRPAADSAARHVQKTFFVKRDLVTSGIAVVSSAAVSAFDLRIAHWARSEGVQGDSSRLEFEISTLCMTRLPYR